MWRGLLLEEFLARVFKDGKVTGFRAGLNAALTHFFMLILGFVVS